MTRLTMKFGTVMSCVLGVALLLPATMAFAQEGLQHYYIKDKQSGRYLTAMGKAGTTEWSYQPVRLAPFDATNQRSQTWHVEWVNGHWMKAFIWNALAGRMLSVDPTTKMVATHPRLHGGVPGNQIWWTDGWSFRADGYGCLDVYYRNGAFGPDVGTWPCHGGANQQWVLYRFR